MSEHLYIVAYDIADSTRLRKVFKILEGYGEWLQLSMFQCRLTPLRCERLLKELEEEIKAKEDHVLVIRVSLAGSNAENITSMGKKFEPITRKPLIV